MKESDTEVRRARHYTAPVVVILVLVLLLALVSFGLAIYVLFEVQHLNDKTATKNDGFHNRLKDNKVDDCLTTVYNELVKLKQENNHLKERLSLGEQKMERQLKLMRAMIFSKLEQAETTSTLQKTGFEANETTIISRARRTVNNPTAEEAKFQCLQGRDGRDGRDGQPGPPGANGITADDLQKVLSTFQESMLQAQKTKTEVKYHNGTEGGAVYIRWGRTSCPTMSKLLYDGIAAGSYYAHTGGGSEKLCLPHKPQWGKYQDGFQSGSYIYGTEYQIQITTLFSQKNANGASQNDHDVPCAVCYTPSRASQLMIPAWRECPATWTKEYSGYLMAENYNHQRSSFNCLDEAPEVVPGGGTNHNGALFYNVEAQCGSLPCPNYVDGRELTCVVCTK